MAFPLILKLHSPSPIGNCYIISYFYLSKKENEGTDYLFFTLLIASHCSDYIYVLHECMTKTVKELLQYWTVKKTLGIWIAIVACILWIFVEREISKVF
uniref:Putative ovule protein n=1 Tax=Solanum chacoense TaxID=4108 RepID=A0A0V0HFF6_SOLCH